MAPWLPRQTPIFGAVFFVSQSLLGIERQKTLRDKRNFKNLQFWPESLGEYWYIERGLLLGVSMAPPQHVNKQYKTRLLLYLDHSRMENQHICRCLFVLQVVIDIYSNQTSQELSVKQWYWWIIAYKVVYFATIKELKSLQFFDNIYWRAEGHRYNWRFHSNKLTTCLTMNAYQLLFVVSANTFMFGVLCLVFFFSIFLKRFSWIVYLKHLSD